MAFRQSPPTLSRFVALAALLALTLALTTLAHEHTHSDPDVRYKPVTWYVRRTEIRAHQAESA